MMISMKHAQLTLIADERPWRLDAETREVGRTGLRKARAALAPHLANDDDQPALAA